MVIFWQITVAHFEGGFHEALSTMHQPNLDHGTYVHTAAQFNTEVMSNEVWDL